MTAALEGGEWSAARPGRTLPPGKTRYPFYRRLGGPQGRSGRGGKSRPHRDSIPHRPARSQSLYRLSYTDHNRNKYQEYFLGGKGGRCVGLEAFPPSCAYCFLILEPHPRVKLRPCPSLYRDCCTFTHPCYGAALNAHSGKIARIAMVKCAQRTHLLLFPLQARCGPEGG